MNSIRFFITISILSLPFVVSGQVIITEVMYDLEGTDSGFEWIEINNQGTESIDIGEWYFYEGEVNHRLEPLNITLLEPDSFAVIIQDEEKFNSLYSEDVSLIKSSFSLNNTTEELSLSNQEKEIVETLRYSSEDGAQGDGNSLHRFSSDLVAGAPSPGFAYSDVGTVKQQEDEFSKKPLISRPKTKKFENYYEPYIKYPETITVGNSVRISAGVFYVKEYSRSRKLKGVFLLNLGNGKHIESYKRIDNYYTFEYPGTYTLYFSYFTSPLAYDAGKDPELVYKQKIKVLDNDVHIKGVTNNGALVLVNNTRNDIDISGWVLRHVMGKYVFPENSVISSTSSIAISYQDLGMYVVESNINSLALYNQQNLLISRIKKELLHKSDLSEERDKENKNISLGSSARLASENTSSEQEPRTHKEETPVAMIAGFIFFSIVLLGVRVWMRNKKTKQ